MFQKKSIFNNFLGFTQGLTAAACLVGNSRPALAVENFGTHSQRQVESVRQSILTEITNRVVNYNGHSLTVLGEGVCIGAAHNGVPKGVSDLAFLKANKNDSLVADAFICRVSEFNNLPWIDIAPELKNNDTLIVARREGSSKVKIGLNSFDGYNLGQFVIGKKGGDLKRWSSPTFSMSASVGADPVALNNVYRIQVGDSAGAVFRLSGEELFWAGIVIANKVQPTRNVNAGPGRNIWREKPAETVVLDPRLFAQQILDYRLRLDQYSLQAQMSTSGSRNSAIIYASLGLAFIVGGLLYRSRRHKA